VWGNPDDGGICKSVRRHVNDRDYDDGGCTRIFRSQVRKFDLTFLFLFLCTGVSCGLHLNSVKEVYCSRVESVEYNNKDREDVKLRTQI
jgi:hypothetical protein